MKFTLILTGFDRVNDIRRFFGSINVQNEISLEDQIIFVNQGKFDPKIEFSLLNSLLYLEIKTGRLPLSVARNIGLKSVQGDIVGFPDDDCWYEPDLLAKVAHYFENHPKTDAICTNVFDPDSNQSYGGRPVGLCTPIGFHNLFELPISVGIFVRTTVFRAAGFHFDERLGAGTPLGSGEETDLIYRLLKNKATVEYVGSIQVYHPVPEYQASDVRKFYLYGLGFGYLNGKIMREREFGVWRHFIFVLIRSLGGCVLNLHRVTKRRLYLGRLKGIVQGFLRGLRGDLC